VDGYKILYVEDKPKDATIRLLFRDYLNLLPNNVTREAASPEDAFREDESDGLRHYDAKPTTAEIKELFTNTCIDFAITVEEALKLLEKNADYYLLFIIDRNLGENSIKELESIKDKYWKEFNYDKYLDDTKSNLKTNSSGIAYYAGDIILEYICLKKHLIHECKERFRFLTGNGKQLEHPDEFLKGLHFHDDTIKAMTIEKNDAEKLDINNTITMAFVDQINAPVALHIQHKYRKVFSALTASELEIDQPEHIKNLITSLAYVENISLEKKGNPRPPSISLLRALLEAFKNKLLSDIKINGSKACVYFTIPIDAQKGYLKIKGKEFDLNKLFSPYCTDRSGELFNFRQDHQHYCHIFESAYRISSQEIHHNERPRFEGYRLQLVVYGICELLLFCANIWMASTATLDGLRE